MTIQFSTHLLRKAAYFSLEWRMSQLAYDSFTCTLNTAFTLIWPDLEVNWTAAQYRVLTRERSVKLRVQNQELSLVFPLSFHIINKIRTAYISI